MWSQKDVTNLDIVKAWIDTLPSERPAADFFGGNVLEGMFEWLYQIGWNVNNYGNKFAPGLYNAVFTVSYTHLTLPTTPYV